MFDFDTDTPAQSLEELDALCHRLLRLSHAESTHANINAHCRAYRRFCFSFGLLPFPASKFTVFRYIAYLVQLGRAYGTILNHLSSIKHVHQYLGLALTWDSDYHYKLLLRGCKRLIGSTPLRKSAITPAILHDIYILLDLRLPSHCALWALCLVAFFSFLRKSNLVPDHADIISDKVLLCQDLTLHSYGATLNIRATKTIQFKQRRLSIPLPHVPDSPLCPVSALKNHLEINRLTTASKAQPLFSVLSRTAGQVHVPVTYAKFCKFLKRVTKILGLDSRLFSPHSFRRGGATFAFACEVPSELIQRQGDWHSDAYLAYLEMTEEQKQLASKAMAQRIQLFSP